MNRAYEWIRIAGKEKPPTVENIHLAQSWVVSQFKNEYNPWHTHSGNFSAVIYLKIPDGMEDHFENEKRDHYPTSGLIDFKFGEKQDMRSDTFLFQKVGIKNDFRISCPIFSSNNGIYGSR